MDPNLQDRLGYHLLKRRGYEQFIAGLINRTEFGTRLAQEWASFPVLAATKGAHRVARATMPATGSTRRWYRLRRWRQCWTMR